MVKQQSFFICEICGNLVGMIDNTGIPMVCCGKHMTELKANTTDASQEKHVPVVEVDGDKVKVKVGSAPHPMTEQHLITWIYLQTEKGGQRKNLKAGDEPEALFSVIEDKAVAAFAYCNLHSLWKADV